MQIIEAIEMLANTKNDQLAYLASIGVSPSTDELALQFNDTYHAFKGEVDEETENSLVKEMVLKNLGVINSLFDNMSNISNNPFWNISSLNGAEWDRVRKLAREVLKIMPNLKGPINLKTLNKN